MVQDIIVGIDLGTTNSVIAYVKDGQPVVIKDGNRDILPSVVGVSPEGEMLVGEPAKNQYVLFPEQTVRSIKRKMGSDFKVTLGGKTYSPQEISAMILLKLKMIAEAHLGHPVKKAVITVPAYFSDAQRKATREAGEIAGFEVARIINEPTAAALAYETGHQSSRKILVYDLGGGTFDVSVVNIQEGVVEVLSSHGNNHLGGDDFDNKIVDTISAAFLKEESVDLKASPKSHARLCRAAEACKITLSDHPFAAIHEEYISERNGVPLHLETNLARADYEEMIHHYIDETLEAVHLALRGAKLTATNIDHILLVGGATRTPLVQRLLQEKFQLEARHEISPDLCVALGAAIQGAMMAGHTVSSVLVDITPYTFGTSALGEVNGLPSPFMYVPLIRKNASLPVSKSDVFFTVHDGQEAVKVEVYQGEKDDARENIHLGEFIVEGLSLVSAGNEIVIRFDLDVNGILKVSALEKATGLEKGIRIEHAMTRFEGDQLAMARKRIGSLLGGPAAPDLRVSEVSEQIDNQIAERAEQLMHKARTRLDDMTPDDRRDVEELIAEIRTCLTNGNAPALEEALRNLDDILFFIDS